MSDTAVQNQILELEAVDMVDYWNVGLKAFEKGQPATSGIQAIWNAMMPPASLNQLALIVGSLWADTYWDTTHMNATKLANDINSAIGINISDATKAANFAFSRWSGLLVRGNTGNSGEIPRQGTLTASMDVIINGQNPLTAEQLIRMWGQSRWSPEPGLKNFVYGRAQSSNIEVDIKKGRLMAFHSDAGFNPPPASWTQLFTYAGDDTAPLEEIKGKVISPNGRAANGGEHGFAFEPPGAGHYCVVVVAQTEFFSNQPLQNGTNWDSYQWLTHNGAAGWHNVNVTTGVEHMLKFYNQDGVGEHFVFEAHCSKVPAGTRITLVAADDRVARQIRRREVITSAHQVVTARGQVPANYEGELVVLIETPSGQPLPTGASVEVRQLWHLTPDHEHYGKAVAATADPNARALGNHVRLHMGDYTFVGSELGD